MKKLGIVFSVIIAISLMPWVALSASAESDDSLGSTGDITITLEAGQYEINQIDEYCVIDMEGFGSILNTGEPKLPSKTFLIGLPPGAEAVSVDMVASDYAEIPGEYRIMPAPPIVSLQENEKVKWGENEETYSSENAYPTSPYEYLGMGQMRKYNFARVGFCPVAYYPASSKLGLYRTITLEIEYEISQVVPPEVLSDTVMDDVASQIIFNYASMKSKYQSAAAPSPVSYNYVVITTESLQSAVEPLVTWKTAIGYSVNVVTTTWISSNYSGVDLPEKIRNFLIDRYAEWGIEYVLIVGSHSNIPMRYCYPSRSEHDSSSRIPTDYYYADLTGDWDSDGDGYFGEFIDDDAGYHPEVYVGRIPIDDSASVTSICQKSVSFEQDSGAWKKKALLLGAIANYSGEDHVWNAWRTDNAVLMEECWNDILKDNGYSGERMYEKEGLSPSTYACEHPLTNSNVLSATYGWPSGYGIVNWGAHGGQTGASRKVWAWDDGDSIPESKEMESPVVISSSDASSLDDSKPAIVFSCSCLNAYTEYAGNLGNSLLQQGAVAFVGATRSVLYVCGWDNSWSSRGFASSTDYFFFDYLINAGQKCGDALYNAQVREYNLHVLHMPDNWQNMFAFCLYGDPSLGTATIAAAKPTIGYTPSGFIFVFPEGSTPNPSTLSIWNSGEETLDWSVGSTVSWLSLSPSTGTCTDETDNVTISVDSSWMSAGDYSGSVTISAPEATNSPQTVPVDLHIYPPENHAPQLSNPSVQPASGTPSTDFHYYVRYYDSDGDSPSARYVYVDGSPCLMSLQSGSASNGVYRCGPKNLSAGSHSYYFYFEDGKGGAARLPISGSYSGPTVSEANNPPKTPSNPSPANHATGVSITADLSWTGGDPDVGDTVTYDVYFGTSAGPPLVSNDQVGTTYDPGTLSYGTKYYWKIVATDSHAASTTGPVWYFTTTTAGPGPLPCTFSGSATLNDAPCPDSIITVQLTDGTPVPTLPAVVEVSAASSYALVILQIDGVPAEGATLNFYVDGNLATTSGDTATWEEAGMKTLDLAAGENNPPQLSNPSVQPTSGTPSTNFYYYVRYYDSDGDSPSARYVYVDGSPCLMNLYSGTGSYGVYRYGPKNLASGNHSYYFYFSDGKGGTARLPTSGSYSEPIVVIGAAHAERDLPGSVEPGANFDVSITASDYGSFGQVVETLPAGFTYVSSSLPAGQVTVTGNVVKFTLLGETSFTYTVTAATTAGTYTFSGIIKDMDLVEFAVTGDTVIPLGWDPWSYDADGDGEISKGEAIDAVQDYFNGVITKLQAIEVVMLYFG